MAICTPGEFGEGERMRLSKAEVAVATKEEATYMANGPQGVRIVKVLD